MENTIESEEELDNEVFGNNTGTRYHIPIEHRRLAAVEHSFYMACVRQYEPDIDITFYNILENEHKQTTNK